jgi:hypothetical protein
MITPIKTAKAGLMEDKACRWRRRCLQNEELDFGTSRWQLTIELYTSLRQGDAVGVHADMPPSQYKRIRSGVNVIWFTFKLNSFRRSRLAILGQRFGRVGQANIG